jgi:hypothetical protein
VTPSALPLTAAYAALLALLFVALTDFQQFVSQSAASSMS